MFYLFKEMTKSKQLLHNPPPHGYITELAKLCNCSRKTVSRALFKGHRGPKSDMVREMYEKIYIENSTKEK